MKELSTTSCTFVINLCYTVEYDWSYFFKIKKKVDWWNGVLTLSWNSLHFPLIGADFIAVFDWEPRMNMKRTLSALHPHHIYWARHLEIPVSQTVLKMYTINQWECCVYSQCQIMPFTPWLPQTCLFQKTTTTSCPSKIHKEHSKPKSPNYVSHSPTLHFPFYHFNVETLVQVKIFLKDSLQRNDWQLCGSEYDVYGKYESPQGLETMVV